MSRDGLKRYAELKPRAVDDEGRRIYSTLARGEGLKPARWGARKAPRAKDNWRADFLQWMNEPDAPKLTPYERAYLKWVRSLECRARLLPGHFCRGRMTAHHAGRRPGMAMRAPHETAIPLCWLAHLDGIEILKDVFDGWDRDRVREWEDDQIRKVRLLAIPEGRDQALDFQERGIGIIEPTEDSWVWVPGDELERRERAA